VFVDRRHAWDEDRVMVCGDNGLAASLPAAWTDVDPLDPFVVMASGRCPFRADDLLAVADLLDALHADGVGQSAPRPS
jgi:hypothetical protein